MIFAGFNVLASKIVSVIIGICFLLTLYWAKNWIARVLPVLYAGVIVGLWFLEDGLYLPYVVLFLGVMTALQSIWDFQGLILHRHPDSDPVKFAEIYGCFPPEVWAFIWCIIALMFMAAFTLLGVMVF